MDNLDKNNDKTRDSCEINHDLNNPNEDLPHNHHHDDNGDDCCCDHSHESDEDLHHEHEDEHEEDDCCCGHDDSDDSHEGCACEKGMFEDIDVQEEKSKKPIAIFGIGAVIFALGYYISTLSLSFFNSSIFGSEVLSQIVYLVVVAVVGKGIIKHGIKSLLEKKVKIEFLVTIATVGAFLLGDGAEGASLILLFFLAEYLEDFALDRSKRSIVKLVNLAPDKALIRKDGKELEIDVKDVNLGDIVLVKPGDKIPVDGAISYGATSINQSSITGESLPVSKKEGDEVYASTINEEGYIEIEVTKKSDNTVFSKIVDLIKESEDKKAKIDLFIDKFAKYYTPFVVALAVAVAIVPSLILGGSLSEWTYKSLVLLVISCPCALAISTPVSMVSAITAGTKNGIIIKGGEYVEELAKIKAILFDKTGTLTEGNLEIANVASVDGFSDDELIKIACSLEDKSKHPIAKSFNEYYKNHDLKLEEVSDFESIPGKGLKGKINGETYYIGKKELFDNKSKNKINNKFNDEVDESKGFKHDLDDLEFKDLGKTEVIVGNSKRVLGFISLTDKIRENGRNTISELKDKKINTMMLTGDNSASALKVSQNLGLDGYYANLLPEDKVKIVEKVSNEYQDVAMVGDGVNDTPSLARANVGIAMGMDGADVAVETADIVLMQDDISKVSFLINLSKKTMGVVKENITVSLAIKGVLAILGVIGYVSLWEAILIGDMGLTLAVVANSLRIGR